MRFKQQSDRFLHSSLIRTVRRELGRIAGSWVLLFTTILGPVAVFLLVSWMFSGAVVRDLPVTVVDNDQTQLSRKIARMIDALPAANVAFKSVSLEEAKGRMIKGEADAVIYIPDGLEKSVQKGVQTELALYLNNTNVVKGGVLQSQLVTALSTFSGGVKMQTMVKKGIRQEDAMSRVLPVKTDVHLLFNPYGNYAYFLMMGLMPLLAVVFIFLGTSYAIGMEMKDGTGEDWIHNAGESTTVALIGKMIPYILLFYGGLMFMNILLIRVMGTPLNGSLALVLFSELLLILAYQAMAVVLLTLTVNLRLTLSLGSAYTMMALTFSGLTFPAMGMPLVAKIFSFVFPYTFWLKVFLSQSLRGEPVHEAILPLLMLLPYILAGVITFPLFKKRLKDERWQSKA
ncbi:MAG: ABC transporter permease [Prolixibacteraceae bacterium]